jgi:hypothetical protein
VARPGLFTHRKLPRLARLAGIRAAEALGLLEFLWHAQYEACSEVVGDALDVETLARWEGEKGVLVLALVDSGFVDANPDGTFSVHDFWDHAPDYVRKRAEREVDRKKRGVTLSEIRAESGRLGAKATNACRPEIGKHPANSRTVAGRCPASVRQIAVTPAPAPAPAPAPVSPLPPSAPDLALTPDPSPASAGSGEGRFEVFWAAYPRKVKPGDALKAWKSMSAADRAAALLAVPAFARAWAGAPRDRREFIPYPASWLRARQWGDDPAEWDQSAASRPVNRSVNGSARAPITPPSFRAEDEPAGSSKLDGIPIEVLS